MPKIPIHFYMSLLLWCAGFIEASAQEDTATKAVIAILEDNLPEEDLTVLSTRLAFYRAHPIDLNHTSAEQLSDLGFLSAQQISNLFLHIRRNGRLSDLLELQGIAGFESQAISQLLPFVTLHAESAVKKIISGPVLRPGEHELLFRYSQVMEQQTGFKATQRSRYLGSPAKLLLRYQYHLDGLANFSFLAEKDAGESFFKGRNKLGFDFYSASLALYKTGRFSKIILGDYGLQFGQGLTIWTGNAFGRGADVAGVAKNGTGLKPYTSANEGAFFRGIANQFRYSEKVDLTTFVSFRALDASLSPVAANQYTLSAVNSSGLHRTLTETAHKQNLKQLVYGTVASYHTERINAGFAAYRSVYQYPFVTGKQLYRQYYFQGTTLSNLGLQYSYTFRNLYFFGELAHSFPGSSASLNGVMASLSRKLSALILYRNYGKGYVTFYPRGLGEGSDVSNERGVYTGLHFSPSKRWDFSAYGDLFFFPWARYRIDRPSSGSGLMLTSSFNPGKSLRFILKTGVKFNAQNDTSGLPVNPVSRLQKLNLRMGVQWKLNRQFHLENRFEITTFKKGKRPTEYGYLFYQDLDYRPRLRKFSAGIRTAWFSTFSYNSRIYAYEDDVQNGSGSGLYNGKGLRGYLNFSYKPEKHLRFSVRYAITYYPGVSTTGSGLDQISGNKKSDIKAQAYYKF